MEDKMLLEDKIFNYWNNKGIIKHKTLTEPIRKSIKLAMKEYNEDDILEAIDNYNMVIKDDSYYYNYKFTLENFLKLHKFENFITDEGETWNNYLIFKDENIVTPKVISETVSSDEPIKEDMPNAIEIRTNLIISQIQKIEEQGFSKEEAIKIIELALKY